MPCFLCFAVGITEQESSKSCNRLLDGKSLVSKYLLTKVSKTNYHCLMHLKTQYLSACPALTACQSVTVSADFTVFVKALRQDLCLRILSWEQGLAQDSCPSGNREGLWDGNRQAPILNAQPPARAERNQPLVSQGISQIGKKLISKVEQALNNSYSPECQPDMIIRSIKNVNEQLMGKSSYKTSKFVL